LTEKRIGKGIKVGKDIAKEIKEAVSDALKPLEASKRLYGVTTFTWIMFSMNVCIPLFALGAIGLQLGLSPLEVVLGAILGNLATTIVMMLNGIPGVRLGIPYPVQLRASWGYKGASIPIILRGLVGAGWFGIEAYSASLAITMLLLYAIGYGGGDINAVVVASFRYVAVILVLYIVFATLAVMKGLRGVSRMIDFIGPLLLIYFLWLSLYLVQHQAPALASTPSSMSLLSKSFALYLAIQTNFWATMSLNISDLSRGLYADERGVKALVIGPLIGIVAASAIASLLGYYLTLYTGLSNPTPQEVVLYRAPGAVAVVIGLLFAALAPFTTDITANIPALMNIFTSVFRMSWRRAALVAGLIGFFIAPWWAVEKGPDLVNYIAAFTANYGLILGPIAGIMIADYYVVKKGRYDIEKLYSPKGYWYRGGYNIAAIAAFLLSIAIIYGVSYAINDINIVNLGSLAVPFPTTLSWYIGVATAFVLYPAIMKLIKQE
jgi:NCS1 family nucleobase:cation symporter-1